MVWALPWGITHQTIFCFATPSHVLGFGGFGLVSFGSGSQDEKTDVKSG